MIKFIVGILCGIACYFILADVYKIPYMKTSKAIKSLSKLQSEKTSSLDVWLGNLASFLAKKIPMNEYKKQQLEADLQTAQIDISPEMYQANAIVKALIVGIFAIPIYFIVPIVSPIVILGAFIIYKMNMKAVSKKITAKREMIEVDLPKFVSSISKKLTHQRGILSFLEDYTKYANPAFKKELKITIADIHSGNEETAIKRLETRVGSTMMSDVCRGFLSLINGDDTTYYWSNLSMKFSDIQRQRLKIEAEKVPKKVKRLSMCLLVCFMLVYVVVILTQIMESVNVMFG